MQNDLSPKSITVNRINRTMSVSWSDGHQSIYGLGLLRAACPCASCRGGHENMHPEPDEEIFSIILPDSPETTIEKVEAVGTYAMTIEWKDGHHFGIYTWHYLRALCPCARCR